MIEEDVTKILDRTLQTVHVPSSLKVSLISIEAQNFGQP